METIRTAGWFRAPLFVLLATLGALFASSESHAGNYLDILRHPGNILVSTDTHKAFAALFPGTGRERAALFERMKALQRAGEKDSQIDRLRHALPEHDNTNNYAFQFLTTLPAWGYDGGKNKRLLRPLFQAMDEAYRAAHPGEDPDRYWAMVEMTGKVRPAAAPTPPGFRWDERSSPVDPMEFSAQVKRLGETLAASLPPGELERFLASALDRSLDFFEIPAAQADTAQGWIRLLEISTQGAQWWMEPARFNLHSLLTRIGTHLFAKRALLASEAPAPAAILRAFYGDALPAAEVQAETELVRAWTAIEQSRRAGQGINYAARSRGPVEFDWSAREEAADLQSFSQLVRTLSVAIAAQLPAGSLDQFVRGDLDSSVQELGLGFAGMGEASRWEALFLTMSQARAFGLDPKRFNVFTTLLRLGQSLARQRIQLRGELPRPEQVLAAYHGKELTPEALRQSLAQDMLDFWGQARAAAATPPATPQPPIPPVAPPAAPVVFNPAFPSRPHLPTEFARVSAELADNLAASLSAYDQRALMRAFLGEPLERALGYKAPSREERETWRHFIGLAAQGPWHEVPTDRFNVFGLLRAIAGYLVEKPGMLDRALPSLDSLLAAFYGVEQARAALRTSAGQELLRDWTQIEVNRLAQAGGLDRSSRTAWNTRAEPVAPDEYERLVERLATVLAASLTPSQFYAFMLEQFAVSQTGMGYDPLSVDAKWRWKALLGAREGGLYRWAPGSRQNPLVVLQRLGDYLLRHQVTLTGQAPNALDLLQAYYGTQFLAPRATTPEVWGCKRSWRELNRRHEVAKFFISFAPPAAVAPAPRPVATPPSTTASVPATPSAPAKPKLPSSQELSAHFGATPAGGAEGMNGVDRDGIVQTLLGRFQSSDMERFLMYGFNVRLNHIAGSGGLLAVYGQVVDHFAEVRGDYGLAHLVMKMLEDRVTAQHVNANPIYFDVLGLMERMSVDLGPYRTLVYLYLDAGGRIFNGKGGEDVTAASMKKLGCIIPFQSR